MNCKCNKCNKVANAEDWNNRTKVVFGNNIIKIEDVDFLNYKTQYLCFNCPNCFENCFVDSGDISVESQQTIITH